MSCKLLRNQSKKYMFGSSYKIATIWGIPIKVHISLIIMMAIFAFRPEAGPFGIIYLLVLEIFIFISIALHELGHSFVAIRKGCRVREITLMFLGGAAQMEKMPSRPMDEFQMAIAGPAVSILIGLICWKAGSFIPVFQNTHTLPFLNNSFLRDSVQSLGIINLGLAIFNLIPAFPMDGGRVFRSMLTPKFGRLKATYIAARLGKIIAILWGIYGLLPPFSFINVALAFFIHSMADREYRMVQMEEAMKQQGFTSWEPADFTESDDPSPDDTDRVVISPPPYANRPNSKTDIHSSDEF